jgi:hypothetical protein
LVKSERYSRRRVPEDLLPDLSDSYEGNEDSIGASWDEFTPGAASFTTSPRSIDLGDDVFYSEKHVASENDSNLFALATSLTTVTSQRSGGKPDPSLQLDTSSLLTTKQLRPPSTSAMPSDAAQHSSNTRNVNRIDSPDTRVPRIRPKTLHQHGQPPLNHSNSKAYPASIQLTTSELPDLQRPSSGQRRRARAAEMSKLGPPRRTFRLRSRSPEPEPCELTTAMVLAACGVDNPDCVEVRFDVA